MSQPAVFFDRDGVLIVDPLDKRVDSIAKLQIFPEGIEALEKIAQLPHLCFIVTNQAGIDEGVLSETDFHNINNEMLSRISESGIHFERILFSTGTEGSDDPRRKPKTGMLEEILADYDIDLEKSFMIGDRDSDILFGQNGGMKTILMNRTDGLSFKHDNSSQPTYTARDLNDVADYIASHSD